MDPKLKDLRNKADLHMSGIIHFTKQGVVKELQHFHPDAQITPLPVMGGDPKIVIGYRFRVTLPDVGSFTLPKCTRYLYDV